MTLGAHSVVQITCVIFMGIALFTLPTTTYTTLLVTFIAGYSIGMGIASLLVMRRQ